MNHLFPVVFISFPLQIIFIIFHLPIGKGISTTRNNKLSIIIFTKTVKMITTFVGYKGGHKNFAAWVAVKAFPETPSEEEEKEKTDMEALFDGAVVSERHIN